MTTRRPLALGALLLAFALSGCADSVEATPSAYRLADTSGTSLTLLVPGGVGDELAEATVTEQTAQHVTVAVRLQQGDTNRPSLEVTLQAHVTLAEPLGDRAVLNQSGQDIPRKS